MSNQNIITALQSLPKEDKNTFLIKQHILEWMRHASVYGEVKCDYSAVDSSTGRLLEINLHVFISDKDMKEISVSPVWDELHAKIREVCNPQQIVQERERYYVSAGHIKLVEGHRIHLSVVHVMDK